MRRSHWKILPALVAIVIFAAVGTASASAASWRVAGAELKGSSALSATTVALSHFTITYEGLEVVCEAGMELKGASITATAGGKIEHLVLKGCRSASSPCGISSTTIESVPLTVTAALGKASPEDTVTLKPTTGTKFAEFEWTGESCAVVGPVALKGTVKVVLPKGQEEHAEMELEVHTEEFELRANTGPSVAFRGKAKAKLTSGQAWSFH
jgi:hypothetical protein